MPLTALLLAHLAHAQGSALWLRGPADPAATVDIVDHPLDLLIPNQGWTPEDARALDALATELAAVRPLVEVFDGELEIMSRLDRAIADVHVLRDHDDRELLARALRFQGFAVRRYFQDGLATDVAAEPYRVRVGETWENGPWMDAVALDPDDDDVAADIPEEPERAAFGETRARVLALPRATLDFGTLPAGAAGTVDGRRAEPAVDGTLRAMVIPGMHRAVVFEGSVVAARGRVRLGPGDVHTLWRRPTRGEMAALATEMDARTTPIRLDPVVVGALSMLEAPVRLVVPSPEGPVVYDVEGTYAVYAPLPAAEPAIAPTPDPEPSRPSPTIGATASLAWVYDPAYAAADGAPKSAAHGFAVQLAASFVAPFGPVTASAGIDVAVPTHPWGQLDTGSSVVRARLQPWLGLGATAIPLTFTIGALLPHHLALGLRARWPSDGPLALSAGWTQGIPLAAGDLPAHVAWIGANGAVPLGRR